MILITNDDGYSSENLYLLYNICKKIDDEVLLVTSFDNHSLKGNLCSLNKKFKVEKIKEGYIIDGTPVDCVRFGLSKCNPDLIVTGINDEYNIGWETLLCSGTFMSAYEGYLHNIKSLACSMRDFDNMEVISDLIIKVLNFDFKLANLNIKSEKLVETKTCKTYWRYEIKGNEVLTSVLSDFEVGSDAEAVFNKNCSSFCIIK